MEENIKVYVQVDNNNCITNVNSEIFIIDITNWVQIDEGVGDKYAHAQGSYLEKGLFDNNGKYNYKLVDGKPVERTEAEKFDLETIKQNKINELNIKCNETIINGFCSDADGTKKLYDFELENQVNLSILGGKIQISKLSGATTIPDISYYAKGEQCHNYNADQFLKLVQDGETFKFITIQKYKKLKEYVESLKTKEEIEKVTWDTIIQMQGSDTNAIQQTV